MDLRIAETTAPVEGTSDLRGDWGRRPTARTLGLAGPKAPVGCPVEWWERPGRVVGATRQSGGRDPAESWERPGRVVGETRQSGGRDPLSAPPAAGSGARGVASPSRRRR